MSSPVNRRNIDTAVSVQIATDRGREQRRLASRFVRSEFFNPRTQPTVVQDSKLPVAHQQQVLTLVTIQVGNPIGAVRQRPQFHLTPRPVQTPLTLSAHHSQLLDTRVDQHDFLALGSVQIQRGDTRNFRLRFAHVVLIDHFPTPRRGQCNVASELLLSHQDRLLTKPSHKQLARADVTQLDAAGCRNRLERSVGLADQHHGRLFEVLEDQEVGS